METVLFWRSIRPVTFAGRRFHYVALILAAQAICSPSLLAAQYYVAKTGSNSNPGTETEPWLTIQKAADEMVAGDTVHVATGTYDEYVVTKTSGLPGNPIVFDGGQGSVMGGFSLRHGYITIQGFEMNAFGATEGAAIAAHLTAHDCVIRSNVFDNTPASTGQVKLFHGDWGNRPIHFTVHGNRFLHSQYFGLSLQGKGHSVTANYFTSPHGGDAIYLNASETLVKGNTFEHWSRPPGSTLHTDLIQSFSNNGEISRDNLILGNLAKDCVGTQIGIVSDDGYEGRVTRWTWCNNIFANVEAAIQMSAPDMHFFNNVFYRGGRNTGAPILFRQTSNGGGSGHNGKVFNNIFFECGSNPSADWQGWWSVDAGLTGFEADHNLVIGTGQGTAKIGFNQPNGINGIDPEFVDAAGFDFRLKATSPCIGAAVSLNNVFTTDFAETIRGGVWDIGAFEFEPGQIMDRTPPSAPESVEVLP